MPFNSCARAAKKPRVLVTVCLLSPAAGPTRTLGPHRARFSIVTDPSVVVRRNHGPSLSLTQTPNLTGTGNVGGNVPPRTSQ
jgi:hypothetical protein